MALITDYRRFLGTSGIRRLQNGLNKLGELQYTCRPGTILMCTGAPNPDLFPFKSAVVELADGSNIKIGCASAFQYSATIGQKDFQEVTKNILKEIHDPPTMDLQESDPARLMVIPTSGNMDGVGKVFNAVLSPGDNLLVEEYTYPMQILEPHAMQVNLLPVKIDRDGMIPNDLRRVLSKWRPEDARDPTSDIPRVINLIPTGQNPTGVTISLERRKEIYQIAQEYDLLIVEDDPYYLIQYEGYLPSFLSMDTDGRVIRCESFSKSIAPGLRTGFVAGPTPILEKIFYHTQVSTFQTCSFSQAAVGQLLTKWGVSGFLEHSRTITRAYKARRDMFIKYAEQHLQGLAEWESPRAGLYLWMKLKGVSDSSAFIPNLIEEGVILTPGGIFSVDMDKPSPYMRASFSVCSQQDMDKGLKCLANAIRNHQQANKGAL